MAQSLVSACRQAVPASLVPALHHIASLLCHFWTVELPGSRGEWLDHSCHFFHTKQHPQGSACSTLARPLLPKICPSVVLDFLSPISVSSNDPLCYQQDQNPVEEVFHSGNWCWVCATRPGYIKRCCQAAGGQSLAPIFPLNSRSLVFVLG